MSNEIPDGVETAVAAAMEAPEAILTAMYEAVLAYDETKDPAVLILFAQARLKAIVDSAPGDAITLEDDLSRPLGKGLSLDEIFARQPT